jgi:hypothetical protein
MNLDSIKTTNNLSKFIYKASHLQFISFLNIIKRNYFLQK